MLQNVILGVIVGILALAVFAVISIVAAIPLYLLWNWLMPELFALKAITYWQAWGLSFLTSILFKSSGCSSKSSSKN